MPRHQIAHQEFPEPAGHKIEAPRRLMSQMNSSRIRREAPVAVNTSSVMTHVVFEPMDFLARLGPPSCCFGAWLEHRGAGVMVRIVRVETTSNLSDEVGRGA